MAVAFHEVRFPEDISYASSGGPAYSTDIVTMKNGSEQRNVNYTQPRCKYNAALGVKTAAQMTRSSRSFTHARGAASASAIRTGRTTASRANSLRLAMARRTSFR